MSEVEKLANKIQTMPLQELFKLCALGIEEKLEPRRLDMILMIAETRLMEYRMKIKLGIK
jgi:hypothetical protein